MADLCSPITNIQTSKSTLSELDVNKIVHNPKLRHDINFDPDLHFRPNLDGKRGRMKTEEAKDFWKTIRGLLYEYVASQQLVDPRFETRSSISLDWLEDFLKSHCAPMRDDSVDELLLQLRNAEQTNDVTMLKAGIHKLSGVLNAMKLVSDGKKETACLDLMETQDIANHQIRCIRPLLLEDTVQFEQKYFIKNFPLKRADFANEATDLRSRRHRRGRGPRPVIGLNGSDDPTDPVCEIVYHQIACLS